MRNLIIIIFSLFIFNHAIALEKWAPRNQSWPFDGIFGHFDRESIQRGFQVYKNVCSACHSLELIAFRNLEEVGFSSEEVKALAAQYQIQDGPNDQGEMYMRPGIPSDKIPSPFPNTNAARAANNGALPPDLSLIIKARDDGANYVHSYLNGYDDQPPADFKLQNGMYYNPYFPGRQTAMPPPLTDGMVTYEDGVNATIDQMSMDVVNFLQWAAEPEMEKRKLMGIKVFIFLAFFTAIFYLVYKRTWSKIK